VKLEDAIKEVREKTVVDLYPQVALLLGMSRGATYQAARNGEIDVIKVGSRYRAVTAPLRKKLGIDAT
jgi:excisionase family DNA binding protein